MTPEVIFRQTATDDLEAVAMHIARDSISRADAFVDRIEARCLQLAEFPNAGRARPDLGSGFPAIAFERRVLIVYAISGRIEIVRVFYGGRDVEGAFPTG